MLHKKTVLVKKRHFYVKKLLFYKLSSCKNTAFLQKYIFVKKQLVSLISARHRAACKAIKTAADSFIKIRDYKDVCNVRQCVF